MKEMIKFDMPKNQSSIIKVIGVGGGGSNAVNHMCRQGIKGVDFIICNTDAQAMEASPVPVKIQLGEKGLGAGSIPSVGKEAAHQKMDQIKEILEKNTQMVFITAGMGGGTGTGAAPVIASIAKELNILTVGMVTIPFTFEGKRRKLQAEEGIKELKKSVDTLLIICNDKIRELYGDLKLSDAFHKADDVLTTAARGIAEIITVTGYINVDFEDVKTVMKESGKAIMGCAQAEGENRAIEAVKTALSSPLLNDNEIEGASDVLLYITSGKEEISMDEVTEITDYIQNEAKAQAEIIWGNGYDETLGNKISITLIATGFDAEKKAAREDIRVRHNLNENVESPAPGIDPAVPAEDVVDLDRIQLIHKPAEEPVLTEEPAEAAQKSMSEEVMEARIPLITEPPVREQQPVTETWNENDRTFVFDLSQKSEEEEVPATREEPVFRLDTEKPKLNGERYFEEKLKNTEEIKPFEVYIKKSQPETQQQAEKAAEHSATDLRSQERIERLRNLSLKFKNDSSIEALENEPAYMRRNVDLKSASPSNESKISKYSLYDDGEGKSPEIRSGNSFLHDNVD